MAHKFSERSLKRMKGISPKLKGLMLMAIAVSPVDFGIPEHGGRRSADEQHELFVSDVSKCDGFINKSNHQNGNAVDIFAYVNGKASWDKKHLALIAGVVMGIANKLDLKIRWGGTFGSNNFDGWDYPHFELIEN